MKLSTIRQFIVRHRLDGLYSPEAIRLRLVSGQLAGQQLGGPRGKWLLADSEIDKLLRAPNGAPSEQ